MATIDGSAAMISRLIQALNQPDPREPLRLLLSRIASEDKGLQRAEEYWELLDLLRETEKCYHRGPSESLTEIAFNMLANRCVAEDAPPQALPTQADSPELADCQQLRTEISRAAASREALDLILLHDGDVLARFSTDPTAAPHRGITAHPGFFELSTDSGWQLWSGTLSEVDLILSASESRTVLRVAAQTDETGPKPTRRVKLASASIVLLVYAGFESGVIRIEPLVDGKQGRSR